MEELIYLAIVVGWFLLNAYRKSQAKKQEEAQRPHRRQQQEEYAPEEATTVEDLLREFMGGEKAPEPVPVAPVPTPAPMRAETVQPRPAARTSKLTVRTPSRRETGAPRTPRGTAAPPETPVMQDERFDLRKAVIHNAILQRPYA